MDSPALSRRTTPKTKVKAGSGQKRPKKRKSLACVKNAKCVCRPPEPGAADYPQVWREMLQKEQLCDGAVRCSDGAEFRIHRAILAGSSPYFRALFTNSINGGRPETVAANVRAPAGIFALILEFAYTGSCAVSSRNVESLLKFADQYEVLGVVHLCCQFLLNNLTTANCLGLLRFANQYFCTDLTRRGRKFVRVNFKAVVSESKELVELTKKELLEIITDDDLNVNDEKIVYTAVMKWINHSPNTRKSSYLELLKCIRFGKGAKSLVQSLLKKALVKENPECLEYLTKIKTELDTDTERPSFRPRVPHDILFAIGGWSAGSPTNFVETYDVRADRWLLSSDTDSGPRAYHGLCALNDVIYVVGGFDGAQYFNSMRRYDPIRHSWQECACMYHHRCYVSVVKLHGKIYALGGFNGRQRMDTVERYDPALNQWELVASMQRNRSDAGAAALREKIYVVGGFNGQEVLKSAEVFNVSANQWTLIPQMQAPRSGVSLVAYNQTIYAFGGFNGYVRLTSGERYTPGESSWWSDTAEMSTPRSNFATAILDNVIYVVGGFNDNYGVGTSTVNFVEYYQPQVDVWFKAAPMNLNRSALSACVISGLPNKREFSAAGRRRQEGANEA